MEIDIEIEKCSEDNKTEWQAFLRESNNGTIFHDLDFLSYHPKEKFNEHHLIFRKKGNIIAVIPGAIINEDLGLEYRSPYGASFGGFVVQKKMNLETNLGIVEKFLNYLKEMNIEKVRITLVPIIYYENINDYLEFSLIKSGFNYSKRQLTSIIYFDEFLDDPFDVMKPTSRTAVRKAVKNGVTVNESDDIDEFYNILMINQQQRHGALPTHKLEDLKYLKEKHPDNFKIYLAYKDDVAVGGIYLFKCNEKGLLTFYISHHPKYENLRPMNLIFYEILKNEKKNNYRALDFGTCHTMGNPFNWGGIRFKESIGGRGVFRNTMDWINKKTFEAKK